MGCSVEGLVSPAMLIHANTQINNWCSCAVSTLLVLLSSRDKSSLVCCFFFTALLGLILFFLTALFLPLWLSHWFHCFCQRCSIISFKGGSASGGKHPYTLRGTGWKKQKIYTYNCYIKAWYTLKSIECINIFYVGVYRLCTLLVASYYSACDKQAELWSDALRQWSSKRTNSLEYGTFFSFFLFFQLNFLFCCAFNILFK